MVRAERAFDELRHVVADKHAEVQERGALEGFGQFGLGVGDTFRGRHRVDGFIDFSRDLPIGYLVFVLGFGPLLESL